LIDGRHSAEEAEAGRLGGSLAPPLLSRRLWRSQCPREEDEMPELDFPGPSSAFRGDKKPRAGSFYLEPRPKKGECLPRELNLEDMAYTGYWRCHGPCYHVQPEEMGEMCQKCERKMEWEKGVR
jgi:hypothetical protein